MKMRRYVAAMVAALALAAVGAGCNRGEVEPHSAPEPEGPAVEVIAHQMGLKDSESKYIAVGTVRSETVNRISAKVMGHVKTLAVEEGDNVKRGDLLITIEASEMGAKVDRAEAGKREAQQALSEVESGIKSAEAGVAEAKANLELAEATFQRYDKLLAEDSVSRQEYDQVKANREMAQAAYERAKEMLASVKAKKEQVLEKIKQAGAGAREANVMESYTKIYAPRDGVVVEKMISEGDLASPGMPLLVIENSEDYRLEATVAESQIQGIGIGQNVEVTIDSIEGERFAGAVDEIKPSADAMSRSFTVKISLPKDPRVRSGMFGRAVFDMGYVERMPVPKVAIVKKGQVDGVYVIGGDSVVRFRPIRLGNTCPKNDAMIEVLSGLNPGETIVADNVDRVKDGGKVTVK